MTPEQIEFTIRWATVLAKLRKAKDERSTVSFDPNEIDTLIKGLQMMMPPKDKR